MNEINIKGLNLYLELQGEFDHTELKSKFKELLQNHGGKDLKSRYTIDIQPLDEIYLQSHQEFDFTPRGNKFNNDILMAIGLMIMVIAMINYVNLSTAQSIKRAKEVGVRKIFGSRRRQMIFQFLTESWMISQIALLFSILVVILILPYFNLYSEKSFQIGDVLNLSNLLYVQMLSSLVGLLGGFYPSLVLSNFTPLASFQIGETPKSERSFTRKGLVIIQFMVAIVLLASTGAMVAQIDFMMKKDLGFDTEQTIVINDNGTISSDQQKMEKLKSIFESNMEVAAISGSSSYPGIQAWSVGFLPDGYESIGRVSYPCIFGDHDFLNTYNIQVLKGRDFDPSHALDSASFLINEAAMRTFSEIDKTWLTNPLDKSLYVSYLNRKGRVVGVFKDIHFEALKHTVKPLIILILPQNHFYVNIRLKTNHMAETLAEMNEQWKSAFPNVPFNYKFVDREFKENYSNDQRLKKLISILSIIAVLIAGLGLFGLSLHLSKIKSKELCIRKVLGATEANLIWIQSVQFIKLALLSNIIALPISYLLVNQWLESFAYRIETPISIFVMTFGTTLLITIITTGIKAIKTARNNPATVLSTE